MFWFDFVTSEYLSTFAAKVLQQRKFLKSFTLRYFIIWFLCWSSFEDFIFAGFRKSLVILLWLNNVCKKKLLPIFGIRLLMFQISFYLQLVQFLNPPECLHPNFPPRKLIQFIFLISFNKQLWITLLDRSSILEFFAVIFYSNLNIGFELVVFEFDDCVFYSYWAWERAWRTQGEGELL